MLRSRRYSRKARGDFWGYILIAAVLAVAGSLTAAYVIFRSKAIEVEASTLCPKDGSKDVTAILFDRTDPLTTIQREDLRKRIQDIKDSIPRFGMLQLYTINAIGEELLRPEITLCNPGRGKDASDVYENPGLVERRWKEEFSARLERIMDELLKPGQAQISPIMESIRSVSISSFAGADKASTKKRLIIASDLLQHTSGHSHYSGLPNFQALKGTPFHIRVRPDLSGVAVEILYLVRAETLRLQGRSHVQFWNEYVKEAGGTLAKVTWIGG